MSEEKATGDPLEAWNPAEDTTEPAAEPVETTETAETTETVETAETTEAAETPEPVAEQAAEQPAEAAAEPAPEPEPVARKPPEPAKPAPKPSRVVSGVALPEELAEVAKKLEDGTFDPLDDSAAAIKAVVKGLKAIEQVDQQRSEVEAFWSTGFKEAYPDVDANAARRLFDDKVAELSGQYQGEALRAVATYAWQQGLEQLKQKPAAKPAAATPAAKPPPVVVKKGAGQALPTGGKVAQPKAPRTVSDKLAGGDYGALEELAGL